MRGDWRGPRSLEEAQAAAVEAIRRADWLRGDFRRRGYVWITPSLENGKTGFVQLLSPGEAACGSTEFIVLRGRHISNHFVYLTAERVKQASRELLASIRAHLKEFDRFWEKEQTKAEVKTFILDEVYANLPTPPFTPEEKEAVATEVYAHVWQQAVRGEFAMAA